MIHNMSEIGGSTTPDALSSYLSELHERLCTGMQGGEITFRECRSELAAPHNTPWARATFSEGQLQQLYYARPTRSIGGVQYVQGVVFRPLEPAESQWTEQTDHVGVNGALNTRAHFISEPDAATNTTHEVYAFILEAMSTGRYDKSPDISPVFYGDTYPVRSWRMHQLSQKLRRAGEIGLITTGWSSPYTLFLMQQFPKIDNE